MMDFKALATPNRERHRQTFYYRASITRVTESKGCSQLLFTRADGEAEATRAFDGAKR